MGDNNIFYAIIGSEKGPSIPATFLQVDGAYVVDPNTYRNSSSILYKDVTQLNPLSNSNHYLVVPASYSLQNSIDYANNLLASLPPITASPYNVEPEGEAAARFVLMNTKLLLDWLPNGSQDLQTHYNGAAGDFVQSFQDAASFAYGAVTALLGYSFEEATAYAGAGNVARHPIQYVQYKLGDNNTKVKFDGDNGFDAGDQAIADVGYNLAIINKTGPIIKADASDEQSSKFTQNSDSSIQYTATLTGQSQPDVINLDPSGNPTLINLVLSDGSSSSLAAGSSGGPTLASVTDGAGHTIQLSLDVTAPVDVSRLGPAVRAGQAFDLKEGVFGGAATDAPYSSIDGLPIITSDSGALKEDALGVGRTVLGADYRVATVTIGSTTASFSSTSLQSSITIRVPDSTDPSIKITVEGGASNNTIYAGDGNDIIFGGGAGNNTIYGNSNDQNSDGPRGALYTLGSIDIMVGGGGDGAAADAAVGATPSETKAGGMNSFYAYSNSNIMIGGNNLNTFYINGRDYDPALNIIWGNGSPSTYDFTGQGENNEGGTSVFVLNMENPTVQSVDSLNLQQIRDDYSQYIDYNANGSITIIINPGLKDKIILDGNTLGNATYGDDTFPGDVHKSYGYVDTNNVYYGFNDLRKSYDGDLLAEHFTSTGGDTIAIHGFVNGDFGVNISGNGPSTDEDSPYGPLTAAAPNFFSYNQKEHFLPSETTTSTSDLKPVALSSTVTVGRNQSVDLKSLINSLIISDATIKDYKVTSVTASVGKISSNNNDITYLASDTNLDHINVTASNYNGNIITESISVIVDQGPQTSVLSSTINIGQSANLTDTILKSVKLGLSGDTLTLVAGSTTHTLGTVSLANGQLTYSANGSALLAALANGPVTDSFGYTVSDQYGDTASNTVTLTVAGAVASVLAGPTYGGGSIQVPIGTTTVNAFYFGNTVYDSGDNTVNAGQGNATIYVASGNVVVNLAGYGNLVTGFYQSGPGAAVGADGNVTISGSQGSSTVQLGNGRDSVILAGYSNAVTLGNGSDAVVAGQGNDTVTLGNGSDHVTIDGYGNTVVAGDGANSVVGGQGSNSVTLGNGADTVSLAGYGNIILLGDGQDTITSGTGGTQVTVGNGNDTINLQGYSNLVRLGSGSDIVNAASYDTLMLNGTTLSLSGGTGETVFLGGNGTSVNDLSSGTSIVASYGSGSATISNFAADSGSVLDLKGGLGGYGTAASVVSALQADGHGGTLLMLGSAPGAASIDFFNTQASMLTASHFQIG